MRNHGPAVQDAGDPQQRALFCKGWLLRVMSLLLLAHHGRGDSLVMHDAVTRVLRTLLLGAAQDSASGENASQLGQDSALMSVFDDLDALSACDLSKWWQQRKVYSLHLQAAMRLRKLPMLHCGDDVQVDLQRARPVRSMSALHHTS
jgi:hypothetical protein